MKLLAKRIASKLPRTVERDDLESAGVIGLIDALEKYDTTRANQFKTYAEFRIRGAIIDEIRSQDWLTRDARERQKQIDTAESEISKRKGRSATEEEVCEYLGISKELYLKSFIETRNLALISINDSKELSESDQIKLHTIRISGDEDWGTDPYVQYVLKEERLAIAKALKSLTSKERSVVKKYYFNDESCKEIGKGFGFTEARAAQIRKSAIGKLKEKLAQVFGMRRG